ncbi:hypothetical protein [Stappia sp. ICDLI1TA098]
MRGLSVHVAAARAVRRLVIMHPLGTLGVAREFGVSEADVWNLMRLSE